MDLKEMILSLLTKFKWLSSGPVVGYCEHGNESSGSPEEPRNFLANCVAETF
jgi:hypothetical protein